MRSGRVERQAIEQCFSTFPARGTTEQPGRGRQWPGRDPVADQADIQFAMVGVIQ